MNGILIVDKPGGFTSFDVIAKLRGVLNERRIGHGGTLDPMATGVLPVFVGIATRAADLLPNEKKRYTATVRMGIRTDTADVTGRIIEQNDCVATREQLESATRSLTGAISQIPPMYSAIQVDGKRLYDLARQGKTVERQARKIEIYKIEILDFNEFKREFTIDVICSKGTYIRTLAEDIASEAGCIAALSALRRTMSSGYVESQAHTLDEIVRKKDQGELESVFLPVESAFSELRKVCLDDNLSRLFLNGFVFDTERVKDAPPDGETVCAYKGGIFLGTAQSVGGKFKKLKQFYFEQ
ncbi:MAG: tRNA pseudouridine(55) synthase TruB [Oscillospiraceae bacterium]